MASRQPHPPLIHHPNSKQRSLVPWFLKAAGGSSNSSQPHPPSFVPSQHHTPTARSMGKVRSFFSRSGRRSKSTRPSSAAPSLSLPPSRAGSPRPSTSARSLSLSLSPSPSSMRKLHEDELERVFRKFDANGDGRVSRSELAALFAGVGHALTDDEVARMMEEVDADGDGYISLSEFAALMAADAAAVEEDLRHAFRVFDADGNGVITPAELASVLRGLGEAATVAQCRRMIRGVDRDGDGQVCFEEFKIMMANGRGVFCGNLAA